MGSGGSRPQQAFRATPLTKVTSKRSKKGAPIEFAYAAMQGWRAKMEDYMITAPNICPGYSLFAVLDGHAGKYAAEQSALHLPGFVAKHLRPVLKRDLEREALIAGISDAITQAFVEMDAKLAKEMHPDPRTTAPPRGGTTVSGVLVTPDTWIFVNCGDSRTVFQRDQAIAFVTVDHKPDSPAENQRIRQCGGTVLRGRVNGTLAVSRALGDFAYKTSSINLNASPTSQIVSPLPDCTAVPRTKADDFMVLASDGLWDVLSSENMMGFFSEAMRTHSGKGSSAEGGCIAAVKQALHLGSYDNMSVMLVRPDLPCGIALADLADPADPADPAEANVNVNASVQSPAHESDQQSGKSALTRSLTISEGQ